MHRLILSVALVLGLSALVPAKAQTILVYGTANPVYLNHLYTISGTAPAQSSLTGQWFVGFNAGVTLNFSTSGPVDLGLDFRGGPQIGTPGVGSALIGFRVAAHTPIFRLKPYGQLSLGFLEQTHNTGSGTSLTHDAEDYFAVELIGGLDYPVTRHIDLRAIELGVGTTRVFETNGINTAQKPGIFNINSGVVYRF